MKKSLISGILLLIVMAIPLHATIIRGRNEPCPVCSKKNEFSDWVSGGNFTNPYFVLPFQYVDRHLFLYHCSQCYLTLFSDDYYEFMEEYKQSSNAGKKESPPFINAIAARLKQKFGSFTGHPDTPLPVSGQLECLLDIYTLLGKEYPEVLPYNTKEKYIHYLIYPSLAEAYAREGLRNKAASVADMVIANDKKRLDKALREESWDEETNSFSLTSPIITTLHSISYMNHCAGRDSAALANFHKMQNMLWKITKPEEFSFSREVAENNARLNIQNTINADVNAILSGNHFPGNQPISFPTRLFGYYLVGLGITRLDDIALILSFLVWLLFFLTLLRLQDVKFTSNRMRSLRNPDFHLIVLSILSGVIVYFFRGFIFKPALLFPFALLLLLWFFIFRAAEKRSGLAFLRLLIFLPMFFVLIQFLAVSWGSFMGCLFFTFLWGGLTLGVEKVWMKFNWSGVGKRFTTRDWYFTRLGIIMSPFFFGLSQLPVDLFSWVWVLQLKHYISFYYPDEPTTVWNLIINPPTIHFYSDPITPPVLYFISGLAILGLLFVLMVVLFKYVKLLRRVWLLLPVVFLAEFGLCHISDNGFPPLFYIMLSVVWFLSMLTLEHVVIRKAPWEGGNMAWAKQLIGMPGWKWARLLLALSPLLIGPLSAPGGNQFGLEILHKIFPG